jgi:hypothetical protein
METGVGGLKGLKNNSGATGITQFGCYLDRRDLPFTASTNQ